MYIRKYLKNADKREVGGKIWKRQTFAHSFLGLTLLECIYLTGDVHAFQYSYSSCQYLNKVSLVKVAHSLFLETTKYLCVWTFMSLGKGLFNGCLTNYTAMIPGDP